MATTEPTEDTFHTYLRRPDKRDGPVSRLEKLYEYCHSASLSAFFSDTETDVSRPLNIVYHSNCFKHGVRCSSESRGPLNARDIYHELIEAECQNARDESSKASGSTIEKIRQRLIFVTNLDCWSIPALLCAAPDDQIYPLRSALNRHLSFQPYVDERSFLSGNYNVEVAFQLPCKNGNSLRQTQNVSFLNMKSSTGSEFIHEAQISCLIAGTDTQWVAYCFVDTFFETLHNTEDVRKTENHEDFTRVSQAMSKAASASSDPKEFFLGAFDICLAQVNSEWQRVVDNMCGYVRNYEQNYLCQHDYPKVLPDSSKVALAHALEMAHNEDWIIKTRVLLRTLFVDLSLTIDACERFLQRYGQSGHAIKRSPASNALPWPPFPIRNSLDELESLQKRLKALQEHCQDFLQDIMQQNQLDQLILSNESNNYSRKSHNYSGQSLTFTMFMMPMTQTAAFFSMQPDVIPFMRPSFKSFMSLMLVFELIGLLCMVTYDKGARQWAFWRRSRSTGGRKSGTQHQGYEKSGRYEDDGDDTTANSLRKRLTKVVKLNQASCPC